ncbi:hypothetical protein MESS2_p60027 [Mesorhizobium metallidurans STM 2683]|uniref:Uncharacterized protein n=1 Tax=Mesorhizobium metallidurans STM 2683 TaxID=1297569 RepID=M5FC97_9HYPH|nr:hypothetical protein MESS2_p60027 [Mesorhizobium metallidurans STM 2683]
MLQFPQPSGVYGPLRSSIEELRFAARNHLIQRCECVDEAVFLRKNGSRCADTLAA